VAALVPGTNDAPALSDSQDIFISWAVLNNFDGGSTTNRFYTQLFLDGILNHTWYSDGLDAGFYSYSVGYNIGKIAAGAHTLRLDTDATGVVAESDETDNSFTKNILVAPGGSSAPQLGGLARLADGTFQFSLTGIPSRIYEIQSSSNLLNWSVLATLQNSNLNGVLQFSDTGATNLDHRFYRARLLP
jgi:hypothetical protein